MADIKTSTPRKIITFGVFDYFHLGHLRLFKQCKEHADYLIVAVQDESCIKMFKPSATVLYSTLERIELLSALKIVDEVVVYGSVWTETLEKVDFDILAFGEDQKGGKRFDDAQRWCEVHGKTVIRLKRTRGISSSQIKMQKD